MVDLCYWKYLVSPLIDSYISTSLLDFAEKGPTFGQPIAKAFIMQDPRAIADDHSTLNQQRSTTCYLLCVPMVCRRSVILLAMFTSMKTTRIHCVQLFLARPIFLSNLRNATLYTQKFNTLLCLTTNSNLPTRKFEKTKWIWKPFNILNNSDKPVVGLASGLIDTRQAIKP